MIKYEVQKNFTEIERLTESKLREEKKEYQHEEESNNELENMNNTKADIDAMIETNIYNIDEHEITTSVTPDENEIEYQQKTSLLIGPETYMNMNPKKIMLKSLKMHMLFQRKG